jgi:hypothetical protein
MQLLKRILLFLGIGNHDFDSELWKTSFRSRRRFVKSILKRRIGIGMDSEELSSTFGEDSTVYLNGWVSYRVSVFKKGKTRDGNTKATLDFYTNDSGIVVDIKFRELQAR